MTALVEVQDLLHRAESDPNVVGLVLTGSQARDGMATEHSDVDVYVVLAEADDQWRTQHSPAIDVPVCTVAELRQVPGPDDVDGWWSRYSFAHCQVLVDRLDGGVERLVRSWGTLTPHDAETTVRSYLDGYVNWAYRSLKSHREGRDFEARLDAVESLSWGLTVIFALEGRVRPYNKYLRWELENHPLQQPTWSGDHLVGLLYAILLDGGAQPQRDLFALVERTVRAAGHGDIIDAWGDELAIFAP